MTLEASAIHTSTNGNGKAHSLPGTVIPAGAPSIVPRTEPPAAVRSTVSVVIPTLNEAQNLGWVLESLPPVDEVIIVDGCSTDGTVRTALTLRPDAVIVTQPPRGKGAAMRAGFAASTSDIIVAIDADGSMDPREITAMTALIDAGYDLVKGSRAACGGASTDLTTVRRLGNRGLVGLYNVLFHARCSDLCYGYLAFRRSCLPALGLYADGFEIESQILSHAQLVGLSMAEVPSREMDRISGESHLRTFRDGRRVLRAILRARLSPGREYWRAQGGAGPMQSLHAAPLDGTPRLVENGGGNHVDQ